MLEDRGKPRKPVSRWSVVRNSGCCHQVSSSANTSRISRNISLLYMLYMSCTMRC